MPSDLLPRPIHGPGNFSSVRISLEVPPGWSISSNVERDGQHEFTTSDPDKAVFLIGPDLREGSTDFGTSKYRLTTSGTMAFLKRRSLEEFTSNIR